MPFTYRPLLRTKAGEASALQQLSPAARQRIFPIFHVVADPAPAIPSQLAQAWAGQELALDGHYNFTMKGSAADMAALFNALRSLNLNVIPSIEVAAPPPLVQVVQQLIAAHGPRVVVKSSLAQLAAARNWVQSQGWSETNADLVVTADHIPDYDFQLLQQIILATMTSHISGVPWRSVTMAASAAPKDMGPLNRGQNDVPRLDWRMWSQVHHQFGFPLDYGDYGISHPDLTEPPGYVMSKATVSARYATIDDWVIYKGVPTTGLSGLPMQQQYRAHAQALVSLPVFGGVANCWGDGRIQHYAASIGGAGGRAQWVAIGLNRHLSVVAHQLP